MIGMEEKKERERQRVNIYSSKSIGPDSLTAEHTPHFKEELSVR